MQNTYQDSAINMHHKCSFFGKSWCNVDGSICFRDCNAIRAVKIWVPLVLSRVFLRFSIIKLSAKWRMPICSWAHCPADALFGETFETLPWKKTQGTLKIHKIYYTPACFSLLRLGSNVFSKLKLWDRNFEGRLPSRHLPKSQLRMSGILAWQNLQAAPAGQFSLWSIIMR